MIQSTQQAQSRLVNIKTIIAGAGLAGNIIGLTYAFRQKKKFWGYVGFMALGGLVIGGIAIIVTAPSATEAKKYLYLPR